MFKSKQPYYLETALTKKSNNLQLIKFLAAIAVIIAHSFPLSGNGDYDWLETLTSGQIDFGQLAVSIFFFTGGLLIAKSTVRLKTFKSYFYTRAVRIFPLLIIVVLFSIIFGSFITYLPVNYYFSNLNTYKYLLNILLIPIHPLPGVFEINPFTNAINGSLWTLPVEFLCYIACFIIYKSKNLKKKNILFFLCIYIIFALIAYHFVELYPQLTTLSAAIQPCYLFLLGMIFFVYRDKIQLNSYCFILALIATILSFHFGLKYLAVWIFLPYLILYLAFMPKQIHTIFSKLGNYSYAIYLCAFPIQQTLTYFNKGYMELSIHLILSIIISVCIGITLYHAFEEPIFVFLQNKRRTDS